MGRGFVALIFPLLLAAAGPATVPTTRPNSEKLADFAFWLDRASQEWAQIEDPRRKPWMEMIEQQRDGEDDAGLKRTLAEFKALVPQLQQLGLGTEYVALAGTYARAGDEEAVQAALALPKQAGWNKQQSSSLYMALARSLVSAARDKEALAAALAAEDPSARLRGLSTIAKTAASDGRVDTVKQALHEARAAAAAYDRDGKSTSGTLGLVRALADARELDQATAAASSLKGSHQAEAEAILALAYSATNQRNEAVKHGQAALAAMKKHRPRELMYSAKVIAESLAVVDDPKTLADLSRFAAQVKAVPLAPDERQWREHMAPGERAPTPGQYVALECYVGLAIASARAGDAEAVRGQLRMAEAVVRAVDPKPLSATWHRRIRLPVVVILSENGHADVAADIAKPFAAPDLVDPHPGGPPIRDVRRAAATAFEKAGDITQATALWRAIGDSNPLLIDHRVTAREYQALLDAIQSLPSPEERCKAFLRVTAVLIARTQ
jgi:hypothetical protein